MKYYSCSVKDEISHVSVFSIFIGKIKWAFFSYTYNTSLIQRCTFIHISWTDIFIKISKIFSVAENQVHKRNSEYPSSTIVWYRNGYRLWKAATYPSKTLIHRFVICNLIKFFIIFHRYTNDAVSRDIWRVIANRLIRFEEALSGPNCRC